MKNALTLTGLFLMLTITAYAQTSPHHLNIDSHQLALDGYDAVAYFTQKKAVKGKSSFAAKDGGVTYYFATQANRDLFMASPTAYKPQYGGWCAYAMGAEGEKVEVDPETFKIVDGKLYLFYNKFFNNTLDTWNKNEAQLKTRADKNWNKLVHP